MTNEMNVPELRFPGFEDEWEETNLGNIANIVGGGTPKTEIPEYWNGEINWYSPVEIGDRNYVYESKNKITQLGLKKSSAKILPIGTVLFTARAGIGNTAILKKEGATNQGFQSIIPKEGVLDTYFIFSRTNELKRYGEIHGAGSTFVEISGKEMAKMPISIPVIKEQQKIGSFFSKLDRQIELEEQKLEKLEEQKKGYMQKLFSQELRFKDDSGCDYPNWKYNYLGNYMISHDEKTTENNQYPVLTSSREGLFLQKDYFTRDVASKDNTGYNVVPYGYFTYRHMSDDLVFKFNINYIVQKGIVSTLYPVFKTTSDLDNYFLKEILNNGNEFKKYALMQKQGGSRTYMYFSKLKQLKLHIPVLKEQEKISVLLKNLDSLIEKQSSKVELLKQRKLGFLQKMFI